MTRKAHCWRQTAIEFDPNILVHDPAIALRPVLKKKKKKIRGGLGERGEKTPHTFFQFLKGNLTRAVEQRAKK